MRKGPLCLMLVTLSIVAPAHGEESTEGGNSTPLSLSAGSQINELQQRLKDSERQREELSKQLQNADGERESAQLARMRQENQRLKLQLKETQAGSSIPRLLTDQQQWFVIGAGVALLALLCGIFASGASRKRRQWLN
ncbi:MULTISPECIES: translation initiation factor 2 [unclassified Pseudomonas]|jgi:chromosome segregation ATPase|uniref:translation initiation factor 2 n=1 Tax=unclassified Pseudomonas TaxID=196821 RepID=UPI00069E3E2D|nr:MULTISPECIES: translation initiation factor 2 [unclassified Pseudomonas]WPN48724.1 translation initiation factor 2 [Pseudomonas sp. P8_241]